MIITDQIREEVIRRSDEWNKRTGYDNWKQHMSLVVDNAIVAVMRIKEQ